MKIAFKDMKEGKIKLVPDSVEDLWHLEHIIKEGDFAEGSTFRSVKFGEKEERKPVFIKVQVERVEFAKHANRLRVGGKIVEGRPEEFVQLGRHHTLDVSPKEGITITKKKWGKAELERIEDAVRESGRALVRVILMDNEKALVRDVKPYGFESIAEIRNESSKRGGVDKTQEFYRKLIPFVEGLCIVAGPGFEKSNFQKFLEKEKKKVFVEDVSYAEESGLRELVEKGSIEKIIGETRLEKEAKVMEELLTHLGRDDGLLAYGKREVGNALGMGAIKTLAVLDEMLRADKEVESIVNKAYGQRADVVVFSKESEWGRKLKGLAGIAAVLRFAIS
ncbi:MAG: mRNA surveillance protein pelota [Candidatus Anstonellales archaeon]